MNESMTRLISAGRSPVLRRVDGIELPAAGRWDVPGNHATIAFSRPRNLRSVESSRGRATGAILEFDNDGNHVSVSVSLEAPDIAILRTPSGPTDSPVRLEARAIGGRVPWTMSGGLFTATGVWPVTAELTYHGVWRHGRDDRDYAWFVLAGLIDFQQGRWHRRPRFSFDLLAYGPDNGIAERDATGPAHQESNTKSQMVLA